MDLFGNIWRIPVGVAAMACSALLIFAAAVVAAIVTRRTRQVPIRLTMAAVVIVTAIAGVVAQSLAAAFFARAAGVSLALIAPAWHEYLAPSLFAAFAFGVGEWRLAGDWLSRRAALFCLWLVVFTAANIINWCSPGWCEALGFPLPWRGWSDVIVVMNDDGGRAAARSAAAGFAIAGVVDLLTFVGVAGVLTLGTRRVSWRRRRET